MFHQKYVTYCVVITEGTTMVTGDMYRKIDEILMLFLGYAKPRDVHADHNTSSLRPPTGGKKSQF